jgi:hypothetical protein
MQLLERADVAVCLPTMRKTEAKTCWAGKNQPVPANKLTFKLAMPETDWLRAA